MSTSVPNDLTFFDLPCLLARREALRELDPIRPPAWRFLLAPDRPLRRLALLPGSFNPPTDAHLALARAALATDSVAAVAYLLASRTVNKERVEGAALADRLILLEEIARERPGESVVLVNRGLYVEQAQLIRAALPEVEELVFLVGFDKIVQIFDPRYYVDFRQALDTLFGLASFLVSLRDEAGPADLEELLATPENRPYADRVRPLALPPQYLRDSSTRVRQQLGAGEAASDVPPIVNRFVAATAAYRPPRPASNGESVDRYACRERAIELAEAGALPPLTPPELAKLVAGLTDLGPRGAALRDLARTRRGDELARILRSENPS